MKLFIKIIQLSTLSNWNKSEVTEHWNSSHRACFNVFMLFCQKLKTTEYFFSAKFFCFPRTFLLYPHKSLYSYINKYFNS